ARRKRNVIRDQPLCSPDGAKRNPGSDPPLTEISARGLDRSAPIRGQPAFTNISMKRRVRPVAGLGDESVVQGIIVDVIDVTDDTTFITNRVLQEPSCPK